MENLIEEIQKVVLKKIEFVYQVDDTNMLFSAISVNQLFFASDEPQYLMHE